MVSPFGSCAWISRSCIHVMQSVYFDCACSCRPHGGSCNPLLLLSMAARGKSQDRLLDLEERLYPSRETPDEDPYILLDVALLFWNNGNRVTKYIRHIFKADISVDEASEWALEKYRETILPEKKYVFCLGEEPGSGKSLSSQKFVTIHDTSARLRDIYKERDMMCISDVPDYNNRVKKLVVKWVLIVLGLVLLVLLALLSSLALIVTKIVASFQESQAKKPSLWERFM
ncbi:hypothetical protein EJF18_60131 [Clavispora lusitaniae]|uniref:Uncharacterized protein n=1 Tax=Clavispora lusitaniae TaxID=36911 RepID=A0ACD0WQG3_CLALS|nr:hypothetical protein EJF14_60131 [Clavispora lusitaniae]QFZ35271.1 hypothetical protein EJF16_60131 [Clavispora lusitaniae]QFZ40965.1 hypothetical protein EJF15_60131 [Clavispora lusitaniae]QFZ46646.1 hypothetical protein EJF18_60131 [Clavispora lusitaniae]QFZ52311.1 hypothetical protein EJF17_60131 [Clavispora lusitaniae]